MALTPLLLLLLLLLQQSNGGQPASSESSVEADRGLQQAIFAAGEGEHLVSAASRLEADEPAAELRAAAAEAAHPEAHEAADAAAAEAVDKLLKGGVRLPLTYASITTLLPQLQRRYPHLIRLRDATEVFGLQDEISRYRLLQSLLLKLLCPSCSRRGAPVWPSPVAAADTAAELSLLLPLQQLSVRWCVWRGKCSCRWPAVFVLPQAELRSHELSSALRGVGAPCSPQEKHPCRLLQVRQGFRV